MSTEYYNDDRLRLLAAYYKLDFAIISELAEMPHAIRRAACKRYNIDPHIFRTMADYTRYPEARAMHIKLSLLGVQLATLRVLDFGCLVADYGLYFARRDSAVTLYDTKAATHFAKFRFNSEGLTPKTLIISSKWPRAIAGKSLVIFGEVLEHLDNPLEVLTVCEAESVRFVYTSCYPFGSDDYFSHPGHKKGAQDLQPACLNLLAKNYTQHKLEGRAALWQLKKHPPELRPGAGQSISTKSNSPPSIIARCKRDRVLEGESGA